MKTSERALTLLRTKGDKRLLTTEEVREITGISVQQWQRLARSRGFPTRKHVGRVWCVNAVELADHLAALNTIDAGMTFTEVAEYARTSTYTLRDLDERGEFIEPIGFVHGRPRYSREQIERWQSKRLGGLEPPPVSVLPKPRKKK